MQQDGRLRTLGVSYPQNQLRQTSLFPVQGSGLSTETPVNGGYRQGHSTSYTQTISQPAQSSVRIVQSSLLSQPKWQSTNSKSVEPQKRRFSLSTAVASGGSVSKNIKTKSGLSVMDRQSTWPVQQGTPRTNKYPSSSSTSVQSPREGYSFRSFQQPVAQKSAPPYYGQGGSSSRRSSTPFSAEVPVPQSHSARSDKTPARRASPRTSKPLTRNDPKRDGKVYKSKLFRVKDGSTRHQNQPSSPSSMVSSPAYEQSGFKPRSLAVPSRQVQSYPAARQNPSSTNSWGSRSPGPGASSFPASRSGTERPKKFAPTRTFNIPEHLGGFAIRRLKEPVNQRETGVQKPQQISTSHQQQTGSYYKTQVQNTTWRKARLHQGH